LLKPESDERDPKWDDPEPQKIYLEAKQLSTANPVFSTDKEF